MGRESMGSQEPASSLWLEIWLYFNRIFVYTYVVASVAIFFYKGIHLPYPTGTIIGELILLLVLCTVDLSRIFLASRGNKTERNSALIWSSIMLLFTVVGYIYFVALQVYVLRLELFLNATALVFNGLSLILGIVAIVSISNGGV